MSPRQVLRAPTPTLMISHLPPARNKLLCWSVGTTLSVGTGAIHVSITSRMLGRTGSGFTFSFVLRSESSALEPWHVPWQNMANATHGRRWSLELLNRQGSEPPSAAAGTPRQRPYSPRPDTGAYASTAWVHDTGAHLADADHAVPSTYATAVTASASGAPVTPHARTLATQAVDSPFLRPYRRGF